MTCEQSTSSRRTTGGSCAVGPDAQSPLHPLAQLSVLVSAAVGDIAERNGLTPMQARMLGVLRRGPLRMAQLGQQLGVEKAALTGLVDRAESRGLLNRQAVPGDRRSIQIVITESGTEAAQTFYDQLAEELDEMIDALPSRQRAAYRSSTARIVAARASRSLDSEAERGSADA